MTVKLAELVDVARRFAEKRDLDTAELYALLKRIDDTTQALAARRIGDLDAGAMSDAIVSEVIRGWQGSKFVDPWNWLTTEGRKDVARCVEDFLTARR